MDSECDTGTFTGITGAMNYTFLRNFFFLLIIGEISLHTAGSWWKYVLKVLGTLFLGIILMVEIMLPHCVVWCSVFWHVVWRFCKKMADCNLQPAGSCWNIDRISDKCVLTWHRSAPSGFSSPARILGHNYKAVKQGSYL